jgi:hypothetical protein
MVLKKIRAEMTILIGRYKLISMISPHLNFFGSSLDLKWSKGQSFGSQYWFDLHSVGSENPDLDPGRQNDTGKPKRKKNVMYLCLWLLEF